MRRVWFFGLLLVTFYLACVFRQMPVLLLFLAEIVLGIVLFVQSRLRAARISAGFTVKTMTVRRGAPFSVVLEAAGGTVLPASRIGLRMDLTESTEPAQRTEPARLTEPTKPAGRAAGAGRKKAKAQRLRVDVDPEPKKEDPDGTEQLVFSLLPERCGLLTLRLRQICPQDALGLFRGHRKTDDTLEIAVLPAPRKLALRPSSAGGERAPEELFTWRRGDPGQDVRDLREYRPGDPVRHVHWKQSARTGTLLVKEFERESGRRTELWLDFSGSAAASAGMAAAVGMAASSSTAATPGAAKWDPERFYTVLDALLRGLLAAESPVLVKWQHGEAVRQAAVRTEEELAPCFWQIYRFPPEGNGGSGLAAGALREDMRLTWDGRWYSGGRLVWQFSEAEYEEEIEENVFSYT